MFKKIDKFILTKIWQILNLSICIKLIKRLRLLNNDSKSIALYDLFIILDLWQFIF